jgi:tripartite-type tricarboxylate transporter receptor subunit TctC
VEASRPSARRSDFQRSECACSSAGGDHQGPCRHVQARSPAAPDVPTADEAGLPGLSLVSWNAIFTPKGTPKDVVGKLNDAVGRTLADPAVDQTLANLGYEVPPRDRQTPESLRAFHKAEIEKWWPITKAAGIKGE